MNVTRTHDDAKPRERSRVRVTLAERAYEAQLRKVAAMTGRLIHSAVQGAQPEEMPSIFAASRIHALLQGYAQLIEPWARRTAWRMLTEVDKDSKVAWKAQSQEISFALRRELENAPTGKRMASLLQGRVELIQSIPRKAAERVQGLVQEAQLGGVRAKVVASQIMESGEVARSNAMRIARTEVSSAATALVQARAEYVGSPGYIWETVRDSDVRHSHKKMQGEFVRWDSPPTLDGMTGHAGQFPNDRCWPRPIIELE